MKKFYAILAAAVAATCVASAQLPATSYKDAVLVPVSGLQMTEAIAPMAESYNSLTFSVNGQSTRKAPARAKAGDAFTTFDYGQYVVTFGDEESPVTTRISPCVIEKGEKDGDAIIKQFFFSDVLDMPATMAYQDLQFSNGTFTLPVLTIPVGTPYVEMEDGTVYNLYLCSPSQSAVYAANDIEWCIDEESGEVWFPYNNTVYFGYFTQTTQGYSGYFLCPSINLFKKNGEMTAMYYYSDEETQEAGFEEVTYPVWTYAYEGDYVDQNQQPTGEKFTGVLTAGWGLCGQSFRFIVEELEENSYVAAAYDQVGWVSGDGDEYVFCDVKIEEGELAFEWVVEGQEKEWMVAVVGQDGNGNTVFSHDGMWTLLGDQGTLSLWQEGTTVLDYNIFAAAGIKDVESVDVNDNAPAEYYNLQGVKVFNPTPGQLYIVKQGSKVSKVIR